MTPNIFISFLDIQLDWAISLSLWQIYKSKPQKKAIKCSSLISIGQLFGICGWVVVVIRGYEEIPYAPLYISIMCNVFY